jgi:hypothetical protein
VGSLCAGVITMIAAMTIISQVSQRTCRPLVQVGDAGPQTNPGPECIDQKKRRLMLFELEDQEDGEVLITLVMPRAWLVKLFGGATSAIIAIIVAVTRLM